MADAYRGLTIRIGADVTNIQSALKSVTSAASQTQSELSKIKRALRLDPGNLTLADRQMGELGKVAAATYEQLNRMRDAYKALGETKLNNGSTLSEFSRGVSNATADAQKLHERFNSINDELARTYNQVERITGVKLDDDHIWSDANIKRLNELNIEFDKTTDNAVTLAQKLQDKGFDIPDSTIQHIATLRENFNETQRAMQDMDKAAGFQKMGTDLTVLEQKAKSAARQLQELNKTSDLGRSPGIQAIDQQLESIDRASADTAKRLEQVNHALQIDPGNVAAAEQQMVLLANQADLAQKKAQLLRQKLEEYRSSGVEQAAQGITNVAENLESSRQAAVRAAQAYEEARGRLADLRQQADNLSSSSGADKEGAKYRELQARIQAAESEVEQYRAAAVQASGAYESAKAVAEFRQTEQAAAEAEAEVSSLTAQMKGMRGIDWGKAAQSMRNVGQALSNNVTQPLVNLGQSSIQTSTEFDSAFRDMKKTVDGTDEDFARLRQSAIDFSTTHVTSADQILEMEAMGGQLGIAVDQLQDFAETASNLDIATDIDADTISQSMGQLVNIMSDLNVTADSTHGGLDNFADSLVRLGNNSPALESQIMDITMRIASQGNIIGMTTPQVLAWSTALASTGQNSEAAGTALSKTMSQIEAAVAGGTSAVADYAEQAGMGVQEFVDKCKNSPKSLDTFAKSIGTTGKKLANEVLKGKGSLQDFADVAGMTADQFAAKWKSEPSAALEDFVKGLKRIDDEGGSMETTLAGLGITAVRQKQGLEGLTQTVDTLDKSLAMSGDAWGGVADQWGDAGDAAREASQKSEGFSGAIGKLKNNWDALKVSIGDGMTPFVESITEGMQQATKFAGTLDDSTKSTIVGLGGIAAATGPAMQGLSFVIDGFRKGASGISAFGSGVSSLVSGGLSALSGMLLNAASAVGEGGLQTKLLGAAGAAESLATSISGPLVGLAITGALTAVGLLVGKILEAKKAQDDFRQAIEDSKTSMGEIDAILGTGSREVEDYAGKTDEAAMSTQELTSTLDDHNQKMRSIADTAGDSISMLGQYKSVLDECAGAGQVSTEQYGRLQWAISGLNKALGTSYTAEDVLKNKYQDESGEIDNLIGKIDQLIQKRQEQARASAYQDLYEEEMKNNIKLADNAKTAASDLADAQQKVQDKARQYMADGATAGQAYRSALVDVNQELSQNSELSERALKNLKSPYDELVAESQEANQSLDESNEKLRQLGVNAGTSAASVSEAGQAVEKFLNSSQDWSNAVQSAGFSVDQLAGAIASVGVSTETLSTYGAANFSKLAQSCDGDISLLVTKLETLNGIQLADKDMKVNSDGVIKTKGLLIDLNDMTINGKSFAVEAPGIFDVMGMVINLNDQTIDNKRFEVVGDGILDVEHHILDLNNLTLDGKELHVSDDGSISDLQSQLEALDGTSIDVDMGGDVGDGSAQQKVDDFRSKVDMLHPSTLTVDANGNVIDGTAQAGIQNTSSAASGLQAYSGHVITIDAQGNAIDLTAKYGIDLTQGSISSLTGKSVLADVQGRATDASLPGTIGGVTSAMGGMTDKSVVADVQGNVVAGLALSAIGFVVGALAGLVDKTATAQYVGNAVDGSAIGSLQASAGALAAMVSRSVTASVTGNAVDGGAASQVGQATSAINSMQSRTVQAQVNGNASDGSGKAQVDATKASINALASKTVSANVTGNAVNGSAAGAIRSTAAAINSLSSRSVTVTVTHRNVTINETQTVSHAKGGVRLNASGGIVGGAPRYLASGAVYTRPTYIDPHNLIAEAGPEYYDGDHIVPLSGRYGKDFAGTIADAIAERYGGGGGDSTTNVYIDGARVNDDAAIEAAFAALLSELIRIVDME